MRNRLAPSPVLSLTRRELLRGTSAALALGALARRAHAAPTKASSIVVSLNESPFGPSPRVLSALRGELRRFERYTQDEARALVQQIAAHEQVAEEQVLVGEILEPLGLELGIQGGAGGEFLYSDPGYTALVDAARPVGGVGVAIPLDGALANDLPAFRRRVGPRTRAVFLVNPHNPSGTVSDARAFKDAVGELAKQTTVIVDEAYLEYTDDAAARSAVELVRADANVIVFRTFSKIHGLAALPIGYALAPRSLAAALQKRGVGSPRSLNRLAVIAASASLRDGAHIERVRALVASERARWHRTLEELGLRHSDARANFVFFESTRPQTEIAAALATQGIQIGRAFPPLSHWTRISIGLPAENARVQSALRKLLGAA